MFKSTHVASGVTQKCLSNMHQSMSSTLSMVPLERKKTTTDDTQYDI